MIEKALDTKGVLYKWASEDYRSKKNYVVTTNCVTISTIHSMKGLDYHCVFLVGLDGIAVGSEILILTWLHESRRDLLRVHPRGNPKEPLRGVFATRSPDRPNPIGLHRAEVLEIQELGRIRIKPLEAIDGTPIIDIKPVLPESEER